MNWMTSWRKAIADFFTFAPFKDCTRGSIYEKSAVYRFNCAHKHLLLERSGHMGVAAILFYGFGMLTEAYHLIWLCAPSYIAVALCFVQIPVFLYGYLYLSKWQHWNSGMK